MNNKNAILNLIGIAFYFLTNPHIIKRVNDTI